MLIRRCISLTVLAVLACLLLALSPLLLAVSLLLSVLPQFRSLPHALLFAFGFLYYECVGVLRLTWVWLCHRKDSDYLSRNQHIQYWWASGLLRLGLRVYGLEIKITGQEAIEGPPALVIARHTSIGDTVLPMIYFAQKRNEGMRYILKRELTVMPCLDIAGHRLPNLFVDRSGLDTEKELEAVRTLTATAGDKESVLVYPEGTRFTPTKVARLHANKPNLQSQLERWPSLLPPRLGGVSAMLEANPGKDVVFLAHTGFEGSASLTDLINGSWRHQQVKLHFWRIPFAEIPSDYKSFIFSAWDEMQRQVDQLSTDT